LGGVCLVVALMTSAPADAQAVSAFNPYDPQWALANPYSSFGFSAGSNTASNQQAYTAKLSSGTVGLFVESGAISGNVFGSQFGSQFFSPISQGQNWFTGLGDPAWKSSIVGSYKSNPNTALFDGLYTTAHFGVTSISATPSGPPGLTNLFGGTNAVGMTASAGLGLQLTPQVSIEGSVSYTQGNYTQGPMSPFR
jgi:hypothetical protein